MNKAVILAGTHAAALALGCLLWDGLVYQPHLAADARKVLKDTQVVRHVETKGAQIAQQARDNHDLKQETIRVVTRDIIQAVPVYVPSSSPVFVQSVREADGGAETAGGQRPGVLAVSGTLPLGFVRLHDYAALGAELPASPSEPIGDPSGVSLPTLAAVLAGNYGVCHADAQEVKTWRDWYTKEAAAWPKTSKQ